MAKQKTTQQRKAVEERPSVPLAELAAQINAEHEQCSQSLRDGLQHAINAGRMLLEAKEKVPHGGWITWIQDHCDFSIRTAQGYMKAAKMIPQLEEPKAQRVALLPLRGALKELAEHVGTERLESSNASRIDIRSAERQAAIELLKNQAPEKVLGFIGDTRRLIETARDTGWASDGTFLVRLSAEEQEGLRELPDCLFPAREAMSPEKVVSAIPKADEVDVLKQVGGFRVPLGYFHNGHGVKVAVLRAEDGRLFLADEKRFKMLCQRHRKATICVAKGQPFQH